MSDYALSGSGAASVTISSWPTVSLPSPSTETMSGEYIVRKTQASGFFGTGLAGWMIAQGADTAVITGCTTSGCVRATVVDAYGQLVAEAVDAHEASLRCPVTADN